MKNDLNEMKAKILDIGHQELVKIHKMIGDTIDRNRDEQQRLKSELIVIIDDIETGHETIFNQHEVNQIADKMLRCTGLDLRKQPYWAPVDQLPETEQELFKQILNDPNGFECN